MLRDRFANLDDPEELSRIRFLEDTYWLDNPKGRLERGRMDAHNPAWWSHNDEPNFSEWAACLRPSA